MLVTYVRMKQGMHDMANNIDIIILILWIISAILLMCVYYDTNQDSISYRFHMWYTLTVFVFNSY